MLCVVVAAIVAQTTHTLSSLIVLPLYFIFTTFLDAALFEKVACKGLLADSVAPSQLIWLSTAWVLSEIVAVKVILLFAAPFGVTKWIKF